jgi:hypothetical protein
LVTVKGICTVCPGEADSEERRRDKRRLGTCLTVRLRPPCACADELGREELGEVSTVVVSTLGAVVIGALVTALVLLFLAGVETGAGVGD